MANNKKERKSYVPDSLFSRKMDDVVKQSSLIKRNSDDKVSKTASYVEEYPWEYDPEIDGEIKFAKYNRENLTKSGYRCSSTHFDLDEAQTFTILAENKGHKDIKLVTAEDVNGDISYEIWARTESDVVDDTSDIIIEAEIDDDVIEEKVVKKEAAFVLDKSIEKVAWSHVERYSLLDGMNDLGFNIYQSIDTNQVYKKVKKINDKTGEEKFFLVRKKREDDLSDNKKVASVLFADDEKTEQTKEASNIVAKKVVVFAGNEEDDQKQTADDVTGPKTKKILLSGDWKKEIDSYLKDCEKNKIIPESIEVKVIKWSIKE